MKKTFLMLLSTLFLIPCVSFAEGKDSRCGIVVEKNKIDAYKNNIVEDKDLRIKCIKTNTDDAEVMKSPYELNKMYTKTISGVHNCNSEEEENGTYKYSFHTIKEDALNSLIGEDRYTNFITNTVSTNNAPIMVNSYDSKGNLSKTKFFYVDVVPFSKFKTSNDISKIDCNAAGDWVSIDGFKSWANCVWLKRVRPGKAVSEYNSELTNGADFFYLADEQCYAYRNSEFAKYLEKAAN